MKNIILIDFFLNSDVFPISLVIIFFMSFSLIVSQLNFFFESHNCFYFNIFLQNKLNNNNC